MSLALCPQVVSQASHHFRSSEKHATCEGCFARQSVCSVVSLHSGMSRAVHPQEFFGRWMSTINTFRSGLPIPLFTFCSKLIKSVRMMACVVWLSPLETIQRRAWVTASTSIVKLEVETVSAALHSWMVVAPCLTVKPHLTDRCCRYCCCGALFFCFFFLSFSFSFFCMSVVVFLFVSLSISVIYVSYLV